MTRAKATIGVIAAILLACIVTANGRSRWEDGARERLSDYIFMEAQRQNALDNASDYFEMLNRAYELDTTQSAIGHDLGYLYMLISDKDSALFAKGYLMMGRHFDKHPEDYYAATFYGTVNDRVRNPQESVRVWTIIDSLYPHKTEITYKLAEALAGSGDSACIRRSIGVYDRLETAEGKQVGISARKIRSLYILRDTAAIVAELHSLFAEAPRSIDNYLFASDMYSMLAMPDTALRYLNMACAIDSTNGLARYKRANFFRERGDSVAFDREVFNAITREDLDLEIKIELVKGYVKELYSDSTQTPRIIQLFKTLEDQYPHEVDVHDIYAAYLAVIGDTKGVAEQLTKSVDIEPAEEERWRMLLTVYINDDDAKHGLEAADRALHYHPRNPMLWFYRGNINLVGGDTIQGIADYHKAIEMTDSADVVKLSLINATIGDTYYQTGDIDSSFAYYERAIELNPANLMACNNYAYFLILSGHNPERAEQLSAITVRNDPDNATFLDTYAWILFKRGDYALARQYIDSAMKYDTDGNPEILEHAGDIYFMDGHPDEALEYWKKALKLDPSNQLLQRKIKQKTYLEK